MNFKKIADAGFKHITKIFQLSNPEQSFFVISISKVTHNEKIIKFIDCFT